MLIGAICSGFQTQRGGPIEAARLLRLHIDLWQQQNYAGPLFHFTYRDMGSDRSSKAENFGLVRRDFSPKDGLATFRSVVRS